MPSAWRSPRSMLAATSIGPGTTIVDHRTWVFLGDGCLMEGISHEVCSLAGTLRPRQADRVLRRQRHFDRRRGPRLVHRRHAAALRGLRLARGAERRRPRPGCDRARDRRRACRDARPTLICCKTIIGWGAPNKQGTEATHGAALGDDEVAAAREHLGWPYAPFVVPDDIRAGWDARGAVRRAKRPGSSALAAYRTAHPELAAEFERRMRGELPAGLARRASRHFAEATVEKPAAVATRASSQQVLNALGAAIPEMLGGSADLTGSNNTNHKGSKPCHRGDAWRQLPSLRRARVRHDRDHERHRAARRLHPVRRHLPGVLGLRAQRRAHGCADEAARRSSSTRTTRSASAKTARRTSRSSTSPSLRLIPNMRLWRPCDTVETAVAWARRDRAHGRADEPGADAPGAAADDARRRSSSPPSRAAATCCSIATGAPECVLIATGSEVALAVEAREGARRRRAVACASCRCPAPSLFDAQDAAYRDERAAARRAARRGRGRRARRLVPLRRRATAP